MKCKSIQNKFTIWYLSIMFIQNLLKIFRRKQKIHIIHWQEQQQQKKEIYY